MDVAIVGGGFCGLAAAIATAEAVGGERVCLVEARWIGEGASGRTGGIALNNVAGGILPGTENTVELVERRLSRWKIDCDFRRGKILRLSHRRSSVDPAYPWSWCESGSRHVAGTEPGGDLDAGKLLSELWGRAHSLGMRIFEETPVVNLEAGDSVRLRVASGATIQSRSALLTTNTRGRFYGRLRRHFLAFETFALATEPLSPRDFQTIGWDAACPFYTLDLPYLWGRSTADGRIIMGSGLKTAADGAAQPAVLKRLIRRFRSLHPFFRDIRIEAAWSGPMAMTRDFYPRALPLDPDRKIWSLGGWCGHGVCLTVEFGARMGACLASGLPPTDVFGDDWRSSAEYGGRFARRIFRLGFSGRIFLGNLLRLRI